MAQCYCVELQQFVFILRRKQWTTIDHFKKHAAERPHVYRVAVWHAEHDFRCSVHPALHVRETGLIVLAARSKVNQFDLVGVFVREEDVLWLDVTMYDTFIFHVDQSFANLFDDLLNLKFAIGLILTALHHHLLVEVNVQRQAFKDYHDAILEDQCVFHE